MAHVVLGSPQAAQLCCGQTGVRGRHKFWSRGAIVGALVQQRADTGMRGGAARAGWFRQGGSSHGVWTLSWGHHCGHDQSRPNPSSCAHMPSHLHRKSFLFFHRKPSHQGCQGELLALPTRGWLGCDFCPFQVLTLFGVSLSQRHSQGLCCQQPRKP